MLGMLKNKNIAIIGASSGIGLSIAQFVASQGANVVIGARRIDQLNNNLETLIGEGNYFACQVDASEEIQVEEFINFSVQKLGPLDGVVHCVGIHAFIPVAVTSESNFNLLFDTNVKSAQFTAKYATKRRKYNSKGLSVVYISSTAAQHGSAGASLYSATKAALEGMSRSMALEFSKRKVRFNCIAPGMVSTDMTDAMQQTIGIDSFNKIISEHPLGLGKAENVAHGVGFLLSDYAEWITGSVLVIDGGYSA
jgi:NAD(P)-dependent dehydrogenase (short-subunit alcohol dehydrogenase family)